MFAGLVMTVMIYNLKITRSLANQPNIVSIKSIASDEKPDTVLDKQPNVHTVNLQMVSSYITLDAFIVAIRKRKPMVSIGINLIQL